MVGTNCERRRIGIIIVLTLWTVNDVSGKDPLERHPRWVYKDLMGSFQVKDALERPLRHI